MDDRVCVRAASTDHAKRTALARPLICTLLLIAAGFAVLPADLSITRWFFEGHCPASIRKTFVLAEVFAHGLGILGIALVIGVLDPRGPRRLPRILTAVFGAGLAANVVKLMLSRARPQHFDFQGTIADTFGDWMPLLGTPSFNQSFPSSHAATAVGLAVVLTWCYPRGRWLFPLLAVLAAGQRVVVGAHFLSDTFWGAAVGYAFATLCIRGPLGAWFTRVEQKLAALRSAGVSSDPMQTCAPQSGAGDQRAA